MISPHQSVQHICFKSTRDIVLCAKKCFYLVCSVYPCFYDSTAYRRILHNAMQWSKDCTTEEQPHNSVKAFLSLCLKRMTKDSITSIIIIDVNLTGCLRPWYQQHWNQAWMSTLFFVFFSCLSGTTCPVHYCFQQVNRSEWSLQHYIQYQYMDGVTKAST